MRAKGSQLPALLPHGVRGGSKVAGSARVCGSTWVAEGRPHGVDLLLVDRLPIALPDNILQLTRVEERLRRRRVQPDLSGRINECRARARRLALFKVALVECGHELLLQAEPPRPQQ
jgi:hypothetical protein